MTPHQTQAHKDGSVSCKIFPGGKWTQTKGPDKGNGTLVDCDSCRFVKAQNRWIRRFHRESVTKVRREGRP